MLNKEQKKSYINEMTAHFEKFDADKIIKNMMNSRKWPENKYYGKTPDEIKSMWDKNRDEASSAGTKMHFDIECYYNECPKENTSVEYSYFKKFIETNFTKIINYDQAISKINNNIPFKMIRVISKKILKIKRLN